MNQSGTTKITMALLLSLAIFTPGCATNQTADKRDPLEGFNRAMFSFNEGLDKAIFKPVAQGYKTVMPDPVEQGVSNVFANIEDVVTTVNDLLQFKFRQAGSDVLRVLFNTTFGLLGIFDIATSMGYERHDEDFGQTLGYWGVGNGPYLVLPVLGPSTVRDITGLVIDNVAFDPIYHIDHIPTRNSLIVAEGISDRAALLSASNVLEKAALDKYDFLKESYLQKRESAVKDGRVDAFGNYNAVNW